MVPVSYFHEKLLINRCITIFGGLILQGGNTKYEGVAKISKKSMLKAIKNNFIYLLSNTASCGMFRQ